MTPIRYFHLLVISIAALITLSGQENPVVEYDVLFLEGTPVEDTPLLVDGPDTTPNDFRVPLSDLPFLVGPYGPGQGEVVVFPPHSSGALRVYPVAWTDRSDTVVLRPAPTVCIPVTIWIVSDPARSESEEIAGVRLSAINAFFAARAILAHEDAGLTLCSLEIRDRSVDPALLPLDVLCSVRNAPEQIKLGFQRYVGRDEGRLNIYFVPLVESEPARGHNCYAPDYIFLAYRSGLTLLTHELGHTLDLDHIDGLADFDRTNVMHGASDSRRFLTEGQIFRAHVSESSSVNIVPDGVETTWRDRGYMTRSTWEPYQTDRACSLATQLRDDVNFSLEERRSEAIVPNEYVSDLVRRFKRDSLSRLLRPRRPAEIDWRWRMPGPPGPPDPPLRTAPVHRGDRR